MQFSNMYGLGSGIAAILEASIEGDGRAQARRVGRINL
jgi:hypothetical protein